MITTLKNLTDNSLPTQNSEPQWWEGGHFPPLALRDCEPVEPAVPAVIAVAPSLPAPPTPRQGWKGQLLLAVILTVLCVGCYFLVSRFVATAVIVQGRSMLPTLHDGDRFILNRLSYFHGTPKRGDLVVVKDPGHNDYAVKRIVAMPHETLLFKRGNVLVNGKRIFEPYLPEGTQTFLPDSREKLVMMGQDQYFVLGDNRGNSEDSRFYGALHLNQIVGSIVR